MPALPGMLPIWFVGLSGSGPGSIVEGDAFHLPASQEFPQIPQRPGISTGRRGGVVEEVLTLNVFLEPRIPFFRFGIALDFRFGLERENVVDAGMCGQHLQKRVRVGGQLFVDKGLVLQTLHRQIGFPVIVGPFNHEIGPADLGKIIFDLRFAVVLYGCPVGPGLGLKPLGERNGLP